MILQVPPGSPAIVRDGAALLLALHVGGGTLGILSGVVALASPKGGAWHRFAGNVFLASMLAMGVIGAAVAPFLPQPQIANVAAGTLACYLVATGWLTVRAAPGGRRGAGVAAAVVATCISLAMAIVGLDAFASPGHELAGVPFEAPFAFSAIAALLAAADVSVIVRGGLSGAQRLARHLWRMNLGLLLAMVSALGQRRITHLVPTAYRTFRSCSRLWGSSSPIWSTGWCG